MIRQCVADHRGDLIWGYHKLRARQAGSRRHIDLHITVDETLTVAAAHETAEHIAADIRDLRAQRRRARAHRAALARARATAAERARQPRNRNGRRDQRHREADQRDRERPGDRRCRLRPLT